MKIMSIFMDFMFMFMVIVMSIIIIVIKVVVIFIDYFLTVSQLVFFVTFGNRLILFCNILPSRIVICSNRSLQSRARKSKKIRQFEI